MEFNKKIHNKFQGILIFAKYQIFVEKLESISRLNEGTFETFFKGRRRQNDRDIPILHLANLIMATKSFHWQKNCSIKKEI